LLYIWDHSVALTAFPAAPSSGRPPYAQETHIRLGIAARAVYYMHARSSIDIAEPAPPTTGFCNLVCGPLRRRTVSRMRTYAPPTRMVLPVRSRPAASRGFGVTASTPTRYACNGFRLGRVVILVMLAFSVVSL